ncbi:MAG: hypothetical protein ACFFE4_23425 [Candidatus Thorarchaeota archaeon]
MNSGKKDCMVSEDRNNFPDSFLKPIIPFSKIVTPFSKIFKSNKQVDIYSGKEKIPFQERDHDYKMILKQEFADGFNGEFKVYKSVISFPSF